ncbi:nucleotidyltransferase domain-containing protein [Candidatus Nanohalobium constans]|uniref:Nucleotidyltransferase domain protein n=1 Tax=Candidatus Nanohalobium constans TaxID=2565781 RepID=A0A5Q0UEY7_9ARCH|nr:nucleotidyltransferase domain-containing protein [Candidatus Nanohalobium constans]QGA80054.1 nucleotidyltransferase domain protein [Candidatus Nanohalobium constans]
MFAELNTRHQKILRQFFQDPELEISARELSRRTDISPAWISKNIDLLSDKKFLEIKEEKASNKITTGENFQELKEVYNLGEIKESGIVENLDKELRPEAIILFGSYEQGNDRKDSDIDIAIINGREKEVNLKEFEKDLERKIELQFIENPKDSDKNFRNSLANGKTLKGFAELI